MNVIYAQQAVKKGFIASGSGLSFVCASLNIEAFYSRYRAKINTTDVQIDI